MSVENSDVFKILIVGAGHLGLSLYREFSTDGSQPFLIEEDPYVVENLQEKENVRNIIPGVPFDLEILEKAGVKNCDMLLAVTSDEITNLLVGQVAYKVFDVPKVIIRLEDQQKREIFSVKNRVFCYTSTQWAINKIKEQIYTMTNVLSHPFMGKKIRYSRYQLPGKYVGKNLNELDGTADQRFILIGAEREGILIPLCNETILKPDDCLVFMSVE